MNYRYIAGITGILLLCSCDCMQHLRGTVVDAETWRPLEGVAYYRSGGTGEYARYTDSLGQFDDFSVVNGFHCKPGLKLTIEKEGYKSAEIKYKRRVKQDSLVIYLEQKKSP